MKTLILLVSLGIILQGCSHTGKAQKQRVYSADSPCADSTYLALKNKPLNDLTNREYDYFKEKQRECQSENAVADVQKTANSFVTTYLIISGVAAVIGLIMLAAM